MNAEPRQLQQSFHCRRRNMLTRNRYNLNWDTCSKTQGMQTCNCLSMRSGWKCITNLIPDDYIHTFNKELQGMRWKYWRICLDSFWLFRITMTTTLPHTATHCEKNEVMPTVSDWCSTMNRLTSGSDGALVALNPDPEHKPKHINSRVKARVSLPANYLLKLNSSLTYNCFHKLSVLASTSWLHVCAPETDLSLADKELLYLVTSNAIWKLVFHHNPVLWIAVERIGILYRITSRTKKCYIYPIM